MSNNAWSQRDAAGTGGFTDAGTGPGREESAQPAAAPKSRRPVVCMIDDDVKEAELFRVYTRKGTLDDVAPCLEAGALDVIRKPQPDDLDPQGDIYA